MNYTVRCGDHFTTKIFSSIVLNPLLNNKMIDMSIFKTLTEDNLNVAKTEKLVFDRVENIAGKGENVGHQHFLLYQQCFSKGFFLSFVKSQNCLVKG